RLNPQREAGGQRLLRCECQAGRPLPVHSFGKPYTDAHPSRRSSTRLGVKLGVRLTEKSVHDATSDEALVNEAERLAVNDTMKIAVRQMEMTRRLNRALRGSELWAKALFALTVVLAVLTAVLVYLAIRQIDR